MSWKRTLQTKLIIQTQVINDRIPEPQRTTREYVEDSYVLEDNRYKEKYVKTSTVFLSS